MSTISTPLHQYTITPVHQYTITPVHQYTLHQYTITPVHHCTSTPHPGHVNDGVQVLLEGYVRRVDLCRRLVKLQGRVDHSCVGLWCTVEGDRELRDWQRTEVRTENWGTDRELREIQRIKRLTDNWETYRKWETYRELRYFCAYFSFKYFPKSWHSAPYRVIEACLLLCYRSSL